MNIIKIIGQEKNYANVVKIKNILKIQYLIFYATSEFLIKKKTSISVEYFPK
jgi:hypothetical protein